jgi:hypothetical protein
MRTERIARWTALGLSALLGLLALAGCPGTLKDKERFLPDGGGGGAGGAAACADVSTVPAQIFANKCGGNGCHGAMAPQQGLDLESPGVAARVVGVPAKECTGILADPQDPAGSVLYTKLLDTPPCGARMPFNLAKLSATEIACVKEWIAGQTGGASTSTGGATASSSASGTGGMGGGGGAGGSGGQGTGTSSSTGM